MDKHVVVQLWRRLPEEINAQWDVERDKAVRDCCRARAHGGSWAALLGERGVELGDGGPRVELVGWRGGVLHALVVQIPSLLDLVQEASSACAHRIKRDQSAVGVDAVLRPERKGQLHIVGSAARIRANSAVGRLVRPRKVLVLVVHSDEAQVDIRDERVVVHSVGRNREEARLLHVDRGLRGHRVEDPAPGCSPEVCVAHEEVDCVLDADGA
mmetsp:Transcript_44030/g.104238  ORF Transcript_44030/g.104238 Transcript_44030/m.104238 type:complete len:213 (+) Transcript_44030:752-1390(+)